MTDRPTILIVEDNEALAEMAVEHLQATVDAKVIRTAGAAETIRLVTDCSPDLMLVDLLLPDGNGLDLIRTIRARDEYPVLIMTGQPTLGRAIEAMRLGAVDLFTKPFDLLRLTTVVKQTLADHQARRRRGQRVERLERLAKKVIRERKELQQRVDLVCRDLVGSYRDLAERFVGFRDAATGTPD